MPVFYRNVPPGLEMTGDQADQVNVHVRGGDTIIAGLGQNQIFIIVDLGDGREGGQRDPAAHRAGRGADRGCRCSRSTPAR